MVSGTKGHVSPESSSAAAPSSAVNPTAASGGAEPLLIGYARVSTEDQRLDLQCDALAAAGCHRTFEDRASGARADRPGLAAALSHLRRGDTLVVWRLDRLGRTTHQLVGLLERFERDGIRLRSLQDGIDPASVMGRAMLQIGAVFAEMERNLVRERTRAGLAAARARGRRGGRKARLSADGLDTARRLMADPALSMEEIASRVGVGRTTLYRALGRATRADAAMAGSGTEHDEKAGRQRRTSGRKPRPSFAAAT
jgi:DNA invertase Pin-like site-specific DNA recombinase